MKRLKGLNEKEVQDKREEFGYNEIVDIGKVNPLTILLRQIKQNFVVYLLFAAVLISLFVGKSITAYTIIAVIFFAVGAGFFQEYKAEKAISKLKSMIMPICIVVREGKETEIPSRELVPEDIIILRTGEKIPADCVIMEESELYINESMLTGETSEIRKQEVKKSEPSRDNLLFMGTYIVSGRCIAKVLYTGMDSEFGKIAGMISTTEKELPLQKKVNNVAKYMVVIGVFFSILIGIIMLVRNAPFSHELFIETLIIVVAVSVSSFPEGFPVVLMSTLATGAYRMANKNAIVNRMSIIETLGETTVICSDKTGTITVGEMTVKKIFCNNKIFDVTGAGYEAQGNFVESGKIVKLEKNNSLKLLLKSAVLCNDAKIERKGTDMEFYAIGAPTEASLLIASAKAGIFMEDLKFTRKIEIPFTSERKLMSVLCEEDKQKMFVYSKGALEILINKCKSIQREDGIFTLTERDKKNIIRMNHEFTSKSLRTLALAYRRINSANKESMERELIFLGLIGIEDPPREGVKEAIKICREAGIKVKMITGDHRETAVAIAKEIGLDRGGVVDGFEIDNFSDDELARIVSKATIFARVKPEHKLRIVRAFKQNGEIVTMTGDGVNDAPALKEAHIGVAMGQGGTDVAREVADLTLKDDNFTTIVEAVKEGRTIFNNIQKFTTYQLSCNFAELFIIFFAILIGLPLPLLALQILFMNLVTDNLPAITLSFNSSSGDVMSLNPRKKSGILSKNLFNLLVFAGVLMGFLVLLTFYLSIKVFEYDLASARTIALVSLISFEIANAFNFRSFRKGVLNRSLFVNKYLVYASIVSIVATLFIIYSPANIVFGTTPIPLITLVLTALTSMIIIFIFDLLKFKKGNLNKEKS